MPVRLGQLLLVTLMLVAQSLVASAEWQLEKQVGGWRVERDADDLFGALASRMTTQATNVSGDHTLVLRCQNNTFDIYVLLNEPLFARQPRTKFIDVVYRFATQSNLTSEWIFRPEEEDRIFFNDTRSHNANDSEYMALVKGAIGDQRFGTTSFIDLMAQDNIWFTWRLSNSDKFAVLIHADSEYRLAFDTSGGAEATKLMFTLCGQPYYPSVVLQEAYLGQRSLASPAQPPVPQSDTFNGQRVNLTTWSETSVRGRTFVDLTLRSKQCLEIQVLQKRPGNTMAVWTWRGARMTQVGTLTGPGGLVGDLEGRVGLSSSDGSPMDIQLRTWTRAGSRCQ